MDGANGSTVFLDSSPNAFTITTSGASQSNTPVPEFGATAGAFGGGATVSAPITVGGPLDLQDGADFTMEGWIYPTALSGQNLIYSDWGNFPSANGLIKFYVNSVSSNQVQFQATESGGSGSGSATSATTAVTNVWQHVAVVCQSGTLCVWLDGVAGPTNTLTPFSNPNPQTAMFLGSDSAFAVQGNTFTGAMQQMRITKGLARYTPGVDFTPPVAPFPAVACVIVVPDVIGDSDSDAQAAILAAFLTVGTITQVTSIAPPGQVVAQSPVGGTPAMVGDPVDLTESQGVPVPNVVNTSLTTVAPTILAAAGFVVGAVTYAVSGTIIPGNVISQNPSAGSFAAAGSGVNLVVSSGLPSLTVPDIYGLDQTDAIEAIETVGLVVGAIGSAPSNLVPPGTVMVQNPSAGTPVAAGSIVSFVLSLGVPATGTAFDFEQTVISQYANSPTLLQLCKNMNDYIDQSANFADFYNNVWNVDTAVGFGLNIWGKIVGVSRLLHIPNTTDYVGFDNSATPPPDWQTMGSNQPPQPAVGGAMYTGYNASQTYLLPDDSYRQLILAKAFANICTTTAPAINTILQNLYGPGAAWVLNDGPMKIIYNLNFVPSAIQLAILEQSGVIPTPPGVAATIVTL